MRREYRARESARACERESTQTHNHRVGTNTHKQTHTQICFNTVNEEHHVLVFRVSLLLSHYLSISLSHTHTHSHTHFLSHISKAIKTGKLAVQLAVNLQRKHDLLVFGLSDELEEACLRGA